MTRRCVACLLMLLLVSAMSDDAWAAAQAGARGAEDDEYLHAPQRRPTRRTCPGATPRPPLALAGPVAPEPVCAPAGRPPRAVRSGPPLLCLLMTLRR